MAVKVVNYYALLHDAFDILDLMRNYKNFIRAGVAAISIGLLALIYNFFAMYALVGKCPDAVRAQNCSAYNNWAMLNKIGTVMMFAGILTLVVGLLKRRQNKQ